MLKSSDAAHNFGVALVALGIAMLVVGIRLSRCVYGRAAPGTEQMKADGLIHADSFPPSFTLMTALLLLAIGILAIASVAFGIGPFE